MPAAASGVTADQPSLAASTAPTAGDGAPAASRVRARRRRVQGRGNVAQVINADTKFLDRLKHLFKKVGRTSPGSDTVTPDDGPEQDAEPEPVMTEEERLQDMKFYMEQIYLIIQPVVCCIILSILWVKLTTASVPNYDTGIAQAAPTQSTAGSSFGVSTSGGNGSAFLSALGILGEIIGATVVIVILFWFNLMRLMYAVFVLIVAGLLGVFGYTLLSELITTHNLALDQFSFWFFLWNMVIVGVLMIFYKGPLILQQCYLVVMSSLMVRRVWPDFWEIIELTPVQKAYTLTKLPALTTWILLALLAVWDLIAVLCPFGPLRILVETAQNEEREIPALLYTAMVWMMATPGEASRGHGRKGSGSSTSGRSDHLTTLTATGTSFSPNMGSGPQQRRASNAPSDASVWNVYNEYEDGSALIVGTSASGTHAIEMNQRTSDVGTVEPSTASPHEVPGASVADTAEPTAAEEETARSGLKLGLGDFVFYSVLVARAALFDWVTTIACTVAVLTGLNMTIFLLAMYQKALPALPISIAFGILFYFLSAVTLTPFVNALVRRPDKVVETGELSWLWVGRGAGSGLLYV
ncbi:hypothetical protein HKX48_006022 [Thoreauomyces humboldtii]|nr:hypothetical protein HKX48_006022 [Thoreauomyces humboldtii]